MLLYQEDAELLFPARIIPLLSDYRGADFQNLVHSVNDCVSESDESVLGFSLMMIRLSSCLTCTADSYRAMNGCTKCAQKTIRSYKGKDSDLVAMWHSACADIRNWQESGTPPLDL